MPKLLQIDSCLGVGSTGKIAEGIAKIAIAQGWECYLMHGSRYKGKTIQHAFQTTTKFGEYVHYFESLIFDRHGLGSRFATKKIINKIKQIRPDIIQLHCIHGYYINYKYLFEFLNTTDIPVVWTQHDCWAFTGHCSHFITANCDKWMSGCKKCPLLKEYPKSLFWDSSKNNYLLKRDLFTSNKNLTIISVSNWLENLLKKSIFKNNKIVNIYNGIDVEVFKRCSNNNKIIDLPENQFIVLGVASSWNESKGLNDFIKLKEFLPENYSIVLVGLNENQIRALPPGIIGIKRTNNIEELVSLYNQANVLVSLSKAETFGLTLVEGMACGTPSVFYSTSALPELISAETGIAVRMGNLKEVASSILEITKHPEKFPPEECRNRVITMFNQEIQFDKYLDLYKSLLKE